MKNFIYWFFDKLFEEKTNNWICGIGLVLAVCYFVGRSIVEFI